MFLIACIIGVTALKKDRPTTKKDPSLLSIFVTVVIYLKKIYEVKFEVKKEVNFGNFL